MTTFSKDVLKSALVELAQSDRAFFASLIADLMSDAEPNKSAEAGDLHTTALPVDKDIKPVKISPPYRKNVKALRKKYAMDKTVLLKLQDLFVDAPTAEEFLQTTKA